MELTQEQTNKILVVLDNYGFSVVSPTNSFNVELIDAEYFNEKVNEALN
jgi:hypothetical protein